MLLLLIRVNQLNPFEEQGRRRRGLISSPVEKVSKPLTLCTRTQMWPPERNVFVTDFSG